MTSVSRMLRRGIPSFTVAAALGFTGAAAFSTAPTTEVVSLVRGEAAVAPPAAEFGHELESRIVLERDERGSIAIGAGAELRLSVKNRFDAEARVTYAVEFVDEFGFEIDRPAMSDVFLVPARESVPVEIELPPALEEGFYLARITAAARSGDESADDMIEQGLGVVDGEALLLTDEEWLEWSYANGGF